MAAVLELDCSPVVWLGMYGSYGTEEDMAAEFFLFYKSGGFLFPCSDYRKRPLSKRLYLAIPDCTQYVRDLAITAWKPRR